MRPVIFGLFLTSVLVLAWPPDVQARQKCPPGQHEVTTKDGATMCVSAYAARRNRNSQDQSEDKPWK